MKTIIVIDRQFGSGGREIAQRIAEKRQIPFYDRKLLERTAKESGFTETLVETQDEKPGNSIIFGLIADTFTDMPIEQDIFYAQQETIRSIARESKNGCVIVGRCADVALRRHTNMLSIFIHAPESFRMERVRQGKAGEDPAYRKLDDKKMLELLKKKDKERWSYYDHYTQQRWGQSKNYDLSINSGLLGIEKSADYILEIIDAFEADGGEKSWIDKRDS